ncbi:Proteasome subunit beta type-1 [Intoshia linei]|uniref:Proteasome subunit beta type-1 n=1 Tax=Intoshia linei TaxID=1819745 RepID=A0A177AVP1_9BILA|nr:Proteasome subunit beta type-1 [Intoshia linei]
MVSKQLYYNRFFPYYVYNLIAGIDKDGVGCVFGYDPVGSYERLNYGCVGSASKLILPMLDNQVALKNQNLDEKKSITLEKALKLIHDVFISASERDIYTGDFLNIYIIQKGKFEEKTIELRRD